MNRIAVGAALAVVTGATLLVAQGRPPLRYHDATQGGELRLVPSNVDAGTNETTMSSTGGDYKLQGNGIPEHLIGSFPNNGNPHSVTQQNVSLSIDSNPRANSQSTPLEHGWIFGVSLHGVVFDPLAAEYWHGDPDSGWSYNALGGALNLGLDTNYAHVQPNGAYHYHGIPGGFLEMVGWSSDQHSPLIGFAADGFPIYAINGSVDGQVTEMTSSYRLKSGNRPGGDAPDGTYDGAFVEDFVYVAGAGNLDECNGAMTVSAEYPNGTYAYFLTETYPVIPRCFAGTPDPSFQHRQR